MESHIHLGRGSHSALGPPVGQPCFRGLNFFRFFQLAFWSNPSYIACYVYFYLCILADEGSESSTCFLLELASFLRSYGCPHKTLVEGPPQQRLKDKQSRLLLLDYLITEYQSSQISFTDKEKVSTISKKTEQHVSWPRL